MTFTSPSSVAPLTTSVASSDSSSSQRANVVRAAVEASLGAERVRLAYTGPLRN